MDDAKYKAMYEASIHDPDAFWGEHGKRIDWIKPYTKVKNASYAPNNVSIKWYEDGTLNVAANCVDRHLAKRGDQVAIIWEGDDPKQDKKITYRQLHAEVCRFANVLKAPGVKKGDRVTIYLPMILEAAYAMLACARIGAVHSVVFGGFSPDSLAGRIEDCTSTVIITADEGVRGGRKIPLKANSDAAADKAGGVTIDDRRAPHRRGRRHEGGARRLLRRDRQDGVGRLPVRGDEAPRTRCSSSIRRARPASPRACCTPPAATWSIVSITHQYVFDYHDGDIYWCTADVGWVTGHSYILYGPLSNGATTLMFEGVPNYPTNSRFWEVIDKHKVNTFYTAPTAIRALMQAGDAPVKKTSRASLRLLGSVGEPINPEAWEWYWRVVGDGRCPIVDTWWQTETGGILITPLPGATRLKPGSATRPFFGIVPQIVDADGKTQDGATTGNLCIAEFLARADAHRLRRPRALRADLFLDLSGQVFHRRRLPARRRRLLLDHRPGRRRDQRGGPPARHRGSRERAGRASEGARRPRWSAIRTTSRARASMPM